MTLVNAKITRKTMATLLLVSSMSILAGCQTTGGNNAVTKGAFGAAAGAIAGAIIGNNSGSGDAQAGALIGAVIGGAGGAYAGCREDGGCGAQPKPYKSRAYDQHRSEQQENPLINTRQYFDSKTGRYYFYDPQTHQEYYENGERKYN